MQFCRHCGNQIPDGGVCNCPGAVAERQNQVNPSQPQQRPQRQGKNFGQKLIEPFTLYFKDPKQAVDNRIKDKDIFTPLIYFGALYMMLIGVLSCIYGAQAFKGSLVEGVGDSVYGSMSGVTFYFALVVLAAFILSLGMCAAYVLARVLILLVVGKKPFNIGKAFIEGFISFGVNSIVPIGLMIIGGLFYMLASLVGMFFFILAAIWYVVIGLYEIKDSLDLSGNKFVKLVIVAGIIGSFLALYYILYRAMFAMNVRYYIIDVYNYSSYSKLRDLF